MWASLCPARRWRWRRRRPSSTDFHCSIIKGKKTRDNGRPRTVHSERADWFWDGLVASFRSETFRVDGTRLARRRLRGFTRIIPDTDLICGAQKGSSRTSKFIKRLQHDAGLFSSEQETDLTLALALIIGGGAESRRDYWQIYFFFCFDLTQARRRWRPSLPASAP